MSPYGASMCLYVGAIRKGGPHSLTATVLVLHILWSLLPQLAVLALHQGFTQGDDSRSSGPKQGKIVLENFLFSFFSSLCGLVLPSLWFHSPL